MHFKSCTKLVNPYLMQHFIVLYLYYLPFRCHAANYSPPEYSQSHGTIYLWSANFKRLSQWYYSTMALEQKCTRQKIIIIKMKNLIFRLNNQSYSLTSNTIGNHMSGETVSFFCTWLEVAPRNTPAKYIHLLLVNEVEYLLYDALCKEVMAATWMWSHLLIPWSFISSKVLN